MFILLKTVVLVYSGSKQFEIQFYIEKYTKLFIVAIYLVLFCHHKINGTDKENNN